MPRVDVQALMTGGCEHAPGGLFWIGLPLEQQLKELRNGFSGRCIFVCGSEVGF